MTGRYRSHEVLGVPPDAPADLARYAHARLASVFDPARWVGRPELAGPVRAWRTLVDDALADHLAGRPDGGCVTPSRLDAAVG